MRTKDLFLWYPLSPSQRPGSDVSTFPRLGLKNWRCEATFCCHRKCLRYRHFDLCMSCWPLFPRISLGVPLFSIRPLQSISPLNLTLLIWPNLWWNKVHEGRVNPLFYISLQVPYGHVTITLIFIHVGNIVVLPTRSLLILILMV